MITNICYTSVLVIWLHKTVVYLGQKSACQLEAGISTWQVVHSVEGLSVRHDACLHFLSVSQIVFVLLSSTVRQREVLGM